MTNMELILQPTKEVYMKLELMTSLFVTVGELTGKLVNMSFVNDSESDIRRTGSLTLHVPDGDQIMNELEGIWLDRLIRVNYGIWDSDYEDYTWFLMGTMLVSENSYEWSAQKQEMTIQIVDMMAAVLDSGGSPFGTPVTVPADVNLKSTIEATIVEFSPFKRHNVCEFEGPVPNEIEQSIGSYPYDLLKQLVEIYPCYEHFYTVDGVYTVQKVPTGIGDPVMLTAEEMNAILISEQVNQEKSKIKNVTEIWGKSLYATYRATNCDGVGTPGLYQLSVYSNLETMEDGMLIAFEPDVDCVAGQTMQIEDFDVYPICIENGSYELVPIGAGDILAGFVYVVKYVDGKFVLLGETEIHAICMEVNEEPSPAQKEIYRVKWNCNNIGYVINPSSPFAVDRIGVFKQVFNEDEFADIYSTKLALERASYENWKTTRRQDTVIVSCLFVPWLDVNQKVEYQSLATGEVSQYLIKSIQFDYVSNTMTLTMTRFYPFYPWLE